MSDVVINSGTPQRVALDLYHALVDYDHHTTVDARLALYRQCLEVVNGG